jgi:hypothetical protein
LHIWDIDAEEAERSNQKVAAAGWQGERNFIELAVDNGVPAGPGTFWHGRHVSHDMTMRNAPRHLDSLRALGLKMGVTKGNRWRSDQEEFDHLAEFCELVVRLGHQETIAWLEILGNEAIINHKYGKMGVEVPNPDYDPNDPHSTPTYTDYSKAVAYAQPMAKLVRDTIGCLTSMGSFDESGHTLKQIKTGVDLVDVHHAWPDPNLGCKHIHTVADYCHYKGEIPNKGILQGENRGVNDPYPFGSLCGNVSTAVNDREDVFTLTAIEQLTNQLSVHLTGPSIRHFCSLDSVEWSFNELPDLMQHIPEDIGAWQGRSFFTNGNKFCWAGRTEWDQMQNPPFNVEHWQTISSKGIEKEGDGIVALRAAMTAKGYIVKGTKS